MKYFKKIIHIFLSFLLILSTVIVHPVEAWATLPNVPDGSTTSVPLPLISIYETLRDTYNDGGTPFNFIKEAIKNSGFLSPEIPALSDLSSLDQYITGNAPDLKGETPEDTSKNVSEFIVNNTTVSDNSVRVNTNVKNFIENISNKYVNDNPCYCYSYSISQMRNAFRSVAQLSSAESLLANDIVNGSPVEIWNFVKGSNSSGSDDWMQCLEVSNYKYLIWRDDGSATNTAVIRCVTPYDGELGTVINQVSKAYRWSTITNSWVLQSATNLNPSSYRYMQINPHDGLPSNNYYWNNIWINSKVCQYRYLPHGSSITVDKVLTQPYYYNNDVWQDFSRTTGDYTFSPSNINTVTYGDTISYIDSFNNTEGYPPSPEQISINIKNENNNNTGGGGSGGDDSGGGSGSDSPSDIFGWLKQLGAVIGSLIKGVGEFLTEIITGLVSAINSLLSGISDLIQNITESLPTVFMDFLGSLFSWLPDEWVALFSACIIFMLLWGIIKTIRGF